MSSQVTFRKSLFDNLFFYTSNFSRKTLESTGNPSKFSIVIFFMYLHTNWYFRWLYQWNWMFIQFFKWKLLSLNTLSDSLNSKSRLSFLLYIQLSHPNPSKNVQGTCELKFPKSKGLVLCTFSQRGYFYLLSVKSASFIYFQSKGLL